MEGAFFHVVVRSAASRKEGQVMEQLLPGEGSDGVYIRLEI